jgi:hypothetical protein
MRARMESMVKASKNRITSLMKDSFGVWAPRKSL